MPFGGVPQAGRGDRGSGGRGDGEDEFSLEEGSGDAEGQADGLGSFFPDDAKHGFLAGAYGGGPAVGEASPKAVTKGWAPSPWRQWRGASRATA